MNLSVRHVTPREVPRVASAPPTAVLAPVHKVALGVAVGAVCGAAVFVLTAFHVVLKPQKALDIGLLSEYLTGYSVSWAGAFVGLFWGVLIGFVAGWFVAFVRNLVIAIRVLTIKGRADLAQSRDFLDHI
jgi:hypothetical protein